MEIPDHLTWLLRNLCAGQEATVRTGHETMDWFQIVRGVHQSCIFSPCLFNLYTEYFMWNAEVDESQGGLKIAGRNISNLRYADVITLMAEKASLVAQTVKRLPTMQETQVQSLGWQDPLEKEMATHSNPLAWKIPWVEEHGRLQSMGSLRVGHD